MVVLFATILATLAILAIAPRKVVRVTRKVRPDNVFAGLEKEIDEAFGRAPGATDKS